MFPNPHPTHHISSLLNINAGCFPFLFLRTVRDVDPVYSLLKCAADLPRQRQGVGHACCMRSAVASGAIPPGSLPSTYNSDNISARNSSRSSSPSSGREAVLPRPQQQ